MSVHSMDQAIPPSPPPSLFESSAIPVYSWMKYEEPVIQSRSTPTSYGNQYSNPTDELSPSDPTMAHTHTSSYGPSVPYPDLQSPATPYDMVPGTSAAAQPYNMTPEASPPIASHCLSANLSRTENSRATRDMKALAVKLGRIEKSSPKKKTSVLSSPPTTRKEKAAAGAAIVAAEDALISQPLSVLTKDWDIPVVDIDAYVRRSVQERHEEVERGKVPGKVKRAMNAFMLYRKAYQDRAKRYAQQSNHQVVSKVCGLSWSMEPRSVRSQFNDWATIERDNHRIAHPEYKFTPSKPRKKADDNLDDLSDLDDPDWHGAKCRSKSRTPMHNLDGGYRPPRNAYAPQYATGVPDMHSYQPLQQHRPILQLTNLGRQTYDLEGLAAVGMYQSGPAPTNLEFSTPSQQSMNLVTAPQSISQHNFDLGDQYTQQSLPQQQMTGSSQIMGLGYQIDPSLVNRDVLPAYDISGPLLTATSLGDSQWQSGNTDTSNLFAGPYFAEMDETYLQETQLQYLRGGEEAWKIGPINESEEWQPE